ncbi:GNAT family N-acetyltransferase [Methylocella tundrae]|uniref:N-acetyltransferase domain-containing protein n=1 Tax=Methylocella tundrae TaxID=227605 RepID=A0A4V6IN95_METTU|nr:GNAT family N-acetyltransferase [Methylocella tundrae]WPP04658.1 GNAT family N-acetyltransferase [Methylocella tundrae]VFU11114.1 conserved protein of unknown function [Methylocella tundrae]
MEQLRNYLAERTLKDGTIVAVRAVRPDDGPKIHKAFKGLSPDTVYSRFFGHKSDVSDAELSHITGVDFDRDVALLVTTGKGEDEMVIGGASYFAIDPAHPLNSADLAFTVEEEYQGLGLASDLLRRLIEIARQKGVARLEADVLADNQPMLAVFRHADAPVRLRREDDIIHVTLALDAAK